MNKVIFKSLLIISMAAVSAAGTVYAYAEAEQSVYTTVQPAVAITKTAASIENGMMNPQNGKHGGLQSVFTIQTNGNDENYDFILTSSVLSSDGGNVSAFGEGETLLFSNISKPPTSSAIANAKIGGDNNPNVIAYTITKTITEPMTAQYEAGNTTYGDCYVIKVNNTTNGTLTLSVAPQPVANTFHMTLDQSGTYQAIVTLTAISH